MTIDLFQNTIFEVTYVTDILLSFFALIAFEMFGVSEIGCIAKLMYDFVTAFAFDSFEYIVVIARVSTHFAAI